jgi:hypothetical protein
MLPPELCGLALIDWSDFWSRDHRAEDWLSAPLLPRRRSIATVSPAKVGKSLLALDAAARLSTGTRFLDRPEGEPLSVVYVDMEMTEDDLAERLEGMGFGPDTDLGHLHYYLLPTLPPLDTPDGGETLLAIGRRHGADLIIIDTTSRVLGGPENDADTLRAYHQCTGLPLKAAGFTVWRLDHAGKNIERGARGTSAKADDVDLVWMLTVREDGLRLKATHRRQAWIPEIVDLVRLEDPLRHERAMESWPAGTSELAQLLDRLGLPIETSIRKAQSALKEAHHGARAALLGAAIRYRREAGITSGSTHQSKAGNTGGNQGQLGFGNHSGRHPEAPAAGNGNHRVPPKGDAGSQPVAEALACYVCGGEVYALDPQDRPVCQGHQREPMRVRTGSTGQVKTGLGESDRGR